MKNTTQLSSKLRLNYHQNYDSIIIKNTTIIMNKSTQNYHHGSVGLNYVYYSRYSSITFKVFTKKRVSESYFERKTNLPLALVSNL